MGRMQGFLWLCGQDLQILWGSRIYGFIKLSSCVDGHVPHHPSFTPYHIILTLFPIVGGGTAGSVVSARLAEEKGWSVLVVEEGGPPPPETRVPALIPLSLLPGHPTDCHHSTTPQRHGLKGYDDRVSVSPPSPFASGGYCLQ